MKNITLLLKNRQFLSDLLNGPCKPFFEEEPKPLEVAISKDGSIRLAEKPRTVFAPFDPSEIDEESSSRITAVYNNLLPAGMPLTSKVVVVKGERKRYIVVTVIPDCVGVEASIGNAISCLDLWEDSRVKARAWVKDADPSSLVAARIEWVNLYVGHDEQGSWCYDLRRMEDPPCRKLVEVYDRRASSLAS